MFPPSKTITIINIIIIIINNLFYVDKKVVLYNTVLLTIKFLLRCNFLLK